MIICPVFVWLSLQGIYWFEIRCAWLEWIEIIVEFSVFEKNNESRLSQYSRVTICIRDIADLIVWLNAYANYTLHHILVESRRVWYDSQWSILIIYKIFRYIVICNQLTTQRRESFPRLYTFSIITSYSTNNNILSLISNKLNATLTTSLPS